MKNLQIIPISRKWKAWLLVFAIFIAVLWLLISNNNNYRGNRLYFANEISKEKHDTAIERRRSFGISTLDSFSTMLKKPHLPLSSVKPFFVPSNLKARRTGLMLHKQMTPGILKYEYEERRAKLLRVVANSQYGKGYKNHVIILFASPVKLMTEDIPYPFRQNSDFLYFSGLQEPDAALLLESQEDIFPSRPKMTLFVKQHDPSRELWDGPSAGIRSAVDFFGATEAFPITFFTTHLRERFGDSNYCIWYNKRGDPHGSKLETEFSKLVADRSNFKYQALHPIGHYGSLLRVLKSKAEVTLLMKSALIGAKALTKVMLDTRANLEESHLHASFEYECRLNGAQRLAFPPVVASGEAGTILHYVNNSQLLRNGELVLMDAGCVFSGYSCDITRTWPVNGKFSNLQKRLYEIVLRVQLLLIERCKVGASLDKLHHEMLATLGSELQDIGLIRRNLSAALLKKETSNYCPHHVGHYLGMDTHDTPLVSRSLELQHGMVITIEPGLYIPKYAQHLPERYRGIGIRIEDDILVTEKGPVVLSSACPKSITDIENLMSEKKII